MDSTLTTNAATSGFSNDLSHAGYVSPSTTIPFDNGTLVTGLASNCYLSYAYPYIPTDTTKKAMGIVKHLIEKKAIKCDKVPEFIALVEEIAGLL